MKRKNYTHTQTFPQSWQEHQGYITRIHATDREREREREREGGGGRGCRTPSTHTAGKLLGNKQSPLTKLTFSVEPFAFSLSPWLRTSPPLDIPFVGIWVGGGACFGLGSGSSLIGCCFAGDGSSSSKLNTLTESSWFCNKIVVDQGMCPKRFVSKIKV